MIIESIETRIFKAPLKTPFKTALRTVEALEDVIVIIRTKNGFFGVGEGATPAVITGETIGSFIATIEHFKAHLIGRNVEDFNEILTIVEKSILHNSSAKSAIESALYDLRAKSLNLPLYKLLGGSQVEFRTDITISLDTTQKMVSDSQEALKLGYEALKLKIGSKSVKEDFQKVLAISSILPTGIALRLDANQAYTPKETLWLLNALEKKSIDIELIEQPVKYDDIMGLKFIKERTLTPVLADEAVFSAKDAIRLLEAGATDYLNIKLAKCGGITEALKIADIANMYNVKCMLGCMLEGVVAINTALHVASARANIITMLDLDGVALLKSHDIIGGALFNESYIRLSDKIGLGVEI